MGCKYMQDSDSPLVFAGVQTTQREGKVDPYKAFSKKSGSRYFYIEALLHSISFHPYSLVC